MYFLNLGVEELSQSQSHAIDWLPRFSQHTDAEILQDDQKTLAWFCETVGYVTKNLKKKARGAANAVRVSMGRTKQLMDRVVSGSLLPGLGLGVLVRPGLGLATREGWVDTCLESTSPGGVRASAQVRRRSLTVPGFLTDCGDPCRMHCAVLCKTFAASPVHDRCAVLNFSIFLFTYLSFGRITSRSSTSLLTDSNASWTASYETSW